MKVLAPLSILAALAVASAQAQEKASGGAAAIDPQAYAGLWYEIARTPTPFQEPCDGGVTATYQIVDRQTVSVLNRCDLPDGSVSRVEGTAKVVGEGFRRLKVDFPQSPPDSSEANYVIEAVGPVEDGRYAWAVVRGPGEGFGWILARSPDLDEEAREAAEDAMQEAGLDPARLEETDQPPETYEPGQHEPGQQ